jgi:hypothetical protein
VNTTSALKDDYNEEDQETGGLHLEGHQILSLVQDSTGDHSSKQRALGKKDRPKGISVKAEEAKARLTRSFVTSSL